MYLNLFFISFLLTFFIYIVYAESTTYCLIFLLFSYIFLFFISLNFGLDILALFILLIYVGGVQILFLFSLFFLNSNKSVKLRVFPKFSFLFNNFSTIAIFLFTLFILFLFVFYFDCSVFYKTLFFENSINSKFVFEHFINFFSFYDFHFLMFNASLLSNVSVSMFSSHALSLFFLFFFFLIAIIILLYTTYDISFFSNLLCTTRSYNYTKFTYFSLCTPNLTLFFNSFFISFHSLLYLSFFLFFALTFFLFFIKNINFLKILIILELYFISIILMLIYFSFLHQNIDGIIFSLFLLGLFAVETAVALSIFSINTKKKQLFF